MELCSAQKKCCGVVLKNGEVPMSDIARTSTHSASALVNLCYYGTDDDSSKVSDLISSP